MPALEMNTHEQDLEYMRMAIKLSKQCTPVESAYNVGAVLVSSSGEILSTGFSREIEGNTHAEECCLLKLSDLKAAKHATMYTTMEPCSQRLSGRKGCAQRLLEEVEVSRVVVGVREPKNFISNCQGMEMLRKAGIQVVYLAELAKECLEANRHLSLIESSG